MSLRQLLTSAGVAAAVVFGASAAGAQAIHWTDWTSLTRGTAGSATGTITIGANTITVTYSGEVEAPSQLSSGSTNHWLPTSTFGTGTNEAPTNNGLIALDGTATVHTITFSSPLSNAFFAVFSMGQGGVGTTYTFAAPFTILSQGPSNEYGGCSTCLQHTGATGLVGHEGDGLLQFTGPITSITWTGAFPEYWNGFTVGADALAQAPSTVPEPSSLALLGTGVAALIPIVRRRRRS